MIKNVGTGDRVARLVVAAVLAFLAFTPAVNGWAAIVTYSIAAYLAITALIDSEASPQMGMRICETSE